LAVIDYGFHKMGLKRIYAFHYVRNPASGAVLNKIGMEYQEAMKSHMKKRNIFEDTAVYGIVQNDCIQPLV